MVDRRIPVASGGEEVDLLEALLGSVAPAPALRR
jgi:hypothetical protein